MRTSILPYSSLWRLLLITQYVIRICSEISQISRSRSHPVIYWPQPCYNMTSFLPYHFIVSCFVKFASFAILVSEYFGVVAILAVFVTKLLRKPGLLMISRDRVMWRPRRKVKCEAKTNYLTWLTCHHKKNIFCFLFANSRALRKDEGDSKDLSLTDHFAKAIAFASWPILAIFKMLSFFEYSVSFGAVIRSQQL